MKTLNLLGKRQKEILGFIEEYNEQNGFPPTVREIGKATGLSSSSTVQDHLQKLIKTGYLRRDSSKPRAIELLKCDERKLVVSDMSKEETNKLFMELVKRGYSVKVK